MRKWLSVITAAVCMLTCPAAAFADTENSIGAELVQTFAAADPAAVLNVVPVEDGNSEAMISVRDEYKEDLREIVIPGTINGYKIVGIDSEGFRNCENLVSVTLPDTIRSLSEYSFSGCKNLVSINIPDSVTVIGSNAFYECRNLESMTLPKSLTTIGNSAFGFCKSLKSIVIPDGVTEIEHSTFATCKALENVTLPTTLEIIRYGAFYECESLKSITIPGSVKEIGSYAFSYCTGLETVMIYNGALTKLPLYCFWATYLKELYIPINVKSIEYKAFLTYNPLTNVYYAGTEEQWDEILIDREAKGNDALLNAKFHYLTPAPGDPNPGEPAVNEPVFISFNIPKQGEHPGITELKASALDTSSGNTVELAVDEENGIDVTGLENGTYTLTVSAKQCAERSYSLTVSGDGLSGEAAGGVEIHLYGDADGDGTIKVADVAKANAYAKGDKSILTGYDLAVCDVNRDGKVNIQDVAKINAHIKYVYNLWN